MQNNFRGLGQALEARIDAAKSRQDYKISLTDPYFKTQNGQQASIYFTQRAPNVELMIFVKPVVMFVLVIQYLMIIRELF